MSFMLIMLWLCASGTARAASTDHLAQIGQTHLAAKRTLVTPGPPKLPDKVFAYGPNDARAVFKPAPKMHTAKQLATALAAARKDTARFLSDYAPAQPSTRRVQQIKTFDWRIAKPGDWQDFQAVLNGAGQWKKITIPRYGEPLGPTNTFYRTTFTLAPWQTNQAVFLRFRGVDYKAHVFVNGAYVGSHEGFFAPFEFDVTRFVRPGTNTLFVQVVNEYPTIGVVNDPRYPNLSGDKLYACTGPGFDDPLAGWHHCPPGMGIYQPVTVEVRPRVHVHDIFVRPLPESHSAEAYIEVWNCDTAPRNIQLHFSVFGLNFKQQVITNQALENLDPAGRGVNFYHVRFRIPHFRWWTLDRPWLYECQVTVTCPAIGTVDHAQRHFGMRSFRLDVSGHPKGRFFLNGKEIRLRGANTMGSEELCVMRGQTNQLRDDFLLAKIAHINFLRITQRPVQKEVYDMADRLGMMIQTDFPLFGHMRPNQFGEGVRQMTEMERLIRSHPSCVLVTFINEPFSPTQAESRGEHSRRMNRADLERFLSASEQAIWHENPDQAIKPIEGDYDPPGPGLPDNHCYTLWYYGHGVAIGRLLKGYWQPVKPGWNYSCGEYGSEGLDRIALMRARCPTNWLPATPAQEKTWTPSEIPRAQTGRMYQNFFDRPDSLAGWVRASRQHQARATRLMTDAFRRDNRMICSDIHLFIDAWPTGWMKAIMDVDRQPKPAYFAYREALTPLMANIRSDRSKFYSGQRMRCEFWICNDTHRTLAKPMLHWELEMGGKIIHAQEAPATVKPVLAVFQGFTSIPVPTVSKRTPAKLRLALFDGAKLVHDTSMNVEFFPKPNPLHTAVQVVGNPDGAAARLARRIGARLDSEAKVYLIDDFQAYQERKSEIDAAIEKGARAIFLDLPRGRYVLPGSAEPVRVKKANADFLSRKTGHPWVAGMKEFDFRFWYNPKSDMITPLVHGKFAGKDWNVILKAQGQMAAAERADGRGQVVLCEVLLADRIETNPTARIFARRMISEPLPAQ